MAIAAGAARNAKTAELKTIQEQALVNNAARSDEDFSHNERVQIQSANLERKILRRAACLKNRLRADFGGAIVPLPALCVYVDVISKSHNAAACAAKFSCNRLSGVL